MLILFFFFFHFCWMLWAFLIATSHESLLPPSDPAEIVPTVDLGPSTRIQGQWSIIFFFFSTFFFKILNLKEKLFFSIFFKFSIFKKFNFFFQDFKFYKNKFFINFFKFYKKNFLSIFLNFKFKKKLFFQFFNNSTFFSRFLI